MKYTRYLLLGALTSFAGTPRPASAQTTSGSIDRLVESIVQNAERLAASMERHANTLAQRIEREVNASVEAKYRNRRIRKSERDYDRSQLEQSARLDTTIAFSSDGSVELSLANGEIVVHGWERAEARIKATSDRGRIGHQLSRSRLILDLEMGSDSWRRSRSGESRFEITVPRGVRVRVRSATGDVSVVDTQGAVDIEATTGDVTVEGARNRAEINSLSGDVSVRHVAGNLDVTTISGTIEVDDVEGEVKLNSTSGDLVLTNGKSSDVEMATSSGEVSFSGSIAADGRYEFTSHSGGIELSVPAALNARFSIQTYSGEIDSAFPITLTPRSSTSGRSRRFEFSVGTGGPRIIAESFSGDIDIRKRN